MNETQIERLRQTTAILKTVGEEREALLIELKPLVEKANRLYYKAQTEVSEAFPYILWSGYSSYPVFSVNDIIFDVALNDGNEFFTALIEYDEYNSGERDQFSWKITVPFDEAKLLQYVESQKTVWLEQARLAKIKKTENELTEKKRQLAALKKEIGES